MTLAIDDERTTIQSIDRAANVLAKAPIEGLRPDRGPSGVLRYPGKVLALQNGGLAIADTGHHRIVLTNARGDVEDVFGTGEAGAKDGPAESATFQRPQGITEVGSDLYVADTGNHRVRRAPASWARRTGCWGCAGR